MYPLPPVTDELNSTEQSVIMKVLESMEHVLGHGEKSRALDDRGPEHCLALLKPLIGASRYRESDSASFRTLKAAEAHPHHQPVGNLLPDLQQENEITRGIYTGLEAFHVTHNEHWLRAAVIAARAYLDMPSSRWQDGLSVSQRRSDMPLEPVREIAHDCAEFPGAIANSAPLRTPDAGTLPAYSCE